MTEQTALKCPNCASPIAPASMDVHEGTARCSYCRAITTLPAFMRRDRVRQRPRMPLPPGVKLDTADGRFLIRRRWMTADWQYLVSVAVAWAVLLMWLGVASGGRDTLMRASPVFFAIVTMVLGYIALGFLINRTWIAAHNGVLSILHGPLPWPGNHQMACAEIDQLFCKETVTQGKHGPIVTYEVWATLSGGGSRKILRALPDDEHAIFFEQQIEAALGIEDRPMPGELYRL